MVGVSIPPVPQRSAPEAPAPVPRRGWLRRNALALGALAVVLPIAATTIGSNEWATANAYLPFAPIDVAEGDSVELYDTEFGPARLREPTASEEIAAAEAPAGARAVVLEFDVGAGDAALSCSVTLREAEGERRAWLPTGSRSACPYDDESSLPFTASAAFLLPSDASGPFIADVEVSNMGGEPVPLPPFIRFAID